MAYTGSRGWMIQQLKAKGITKLDSLKIEKLGKQELISLYNKVGR